MMAHLSVTALPAEGASVGRYVRCAVDVLRASGLSHEVLAMGTEIEFGALRELWPVIETIDEELVKMGATRVTIQLKIDDRRDRAVTREDKVDSAKRGPRKTRGRR